MWQFFSPEIEKWITLIVVVIVFALILHRKVPIHYLSLGAASLLIALGIIPIRIQNEGVPDDFEDFDRRIFLREYYPRLQTDPGHRI